MGYTQFEPKARAEGDGTITDSKSVHVKDMEKEEILYMECKDIEKATWHNDPYIGYKVLKQMCLMGVFMVIGFHYGIISATLPDLRDRLGVLQEEISLILMGKSIGFLFGAILGGFLFRIYITKGQHMILVALLITAAAMGGIPFANSLWLTVVFYTIAGITEGVTNTGASTMILDLWEANSVIPMSVAHCGVGLGSLISPQIAKLLLIEEHLPVDTPSNASAAILDNAANISVQESSKQDSPHVYEKEYGLQLSYIIVASMILVIAIGHFFLLVIGPPKNYPRRAAEELVKKTTFKEMASPGSCANGATCYSSQLLALLFFFCFFSAGTKKSFGNFLFSFATEGCLGMPRVQAANLQSTFWMFYMCGRGLAGFVTLVIPLQVFLFLVCCCNVIMGGIVSFFTMDSSLTLWICTCIFAMSCAVLLPMCMAWANMYLHMNSLATMVLLCGLSTGEFAFVALSGYLYDVLGPDTVKYVSALSSVCLLIVFVIMQIVGHLNRSVLNVEINVVEVKDSLMNAENEKSEIAKEKV